MSRSYRYNPADDSTSMGEIDCSEGKTRCIKDRPTSMGERLPSWAKSRSATQQTFRCRHCKMMVGPVPSGGKQRNHCPYCLYSRHVDGAKPGDRQSHCGGSMAPVGVFTRSRGEHVLVHRCLACNFQRYNRIAADDDFDLVLSLPVIALRSSSTMNIVDAGDVDRFLRATAGNEATEQQDNVPSINAGDRAS